MSGVPPMPFTNARTVRPLEAKVADDRFHEHPGDVVDRRELLAPATRLAVDADADLHLVVGRSKVGVPAAGTMQQVSAMPMERTLALTLTAVAVTSASEPPASACAPGDLFDEDGPADATSTRGVERVLDRDIVIGHDRRNLDLARHELGGHLEVQHVARVVLDDVQDARAAVDRPRRGLHLVRDGRGEDVAGRGRVEHPESDEAAMERLVARAAARDQGDLAPLRPAGAEDEQVGASIFTRSGWARPEAGQALGDEVLDVVDELLHASAHWWPSDRSLVVVDWVGRFPVFRRRRGRPPDAAPGNLGRAVVADELVQERSDRPPRIGPTI